jgi:hypothetical protein
MHLPTITEEDLKTFHLEHFPATPLPQSFGSVQDEDQEQEHELGYYPDGTKRTLTDDQIAMFRHSEIQQLLRALRLQRTTSSRESGSVNDVGTTSAADVAQTSYVQNRDKMDSKKWPVSKTSFRYWSQTQVLVKRSATDTNRGASNQPRPAKKHKRSNRAPQSPINGVRHNPEDYLEEGEEHTYRRKCREADEQREEVVFLDY